MSKCILFLCVFLQLSLLSQSQTPLTIELKPKPAWIEKGETQQYLNFDIQITNSSADTLTLTKIAVNVYDKQNRMIHSRFLNNNGTAPSIQTVPNRTFNGPASRLFFNPFSAFDLGLLLSKLEYEFTFTNPKNEVQVFKKQIIPTPFQQTEKYQFPLRGKVWVYDGHDYFSHHRRFDYEFPFIKELGLQANFMRYAYDFILLDENNQSFKGDAQKDENYMGFGKPVYAVGSGKVIYVSNKYKDDKTFDVPQLKTNPLELYGNCVAIQHANGAISIYGHLKQNNLQVKANDQVKAGAEIAKIGVSGSSFLPHLHFEMRTSLKADAEGLPSYFSNVHLLQTDGKKKLQSGLVETGNILQTE